MSNPVVIIGAGLAGLSCANRLHSDGRDFVLLEASDAVGGRVRTDQVDGFLLDRGFQVLLTAYPEAARVLNYDALDLKRFEPGSLIRTVDGFQRLSDPWRQPQRVLSTAVARVGSLFDKLCVGRLRLSAGRGTLQSLFEREDQTTELELRKLGFSEAMVSKFLRPFLGGVFLDHDLQTSCRMLYFVFRMFSQGDAALPSAGMAAIPNQLAGNLPSDSIRLNTRVTEIKDRNVVLDSGEVISCSDVVLATEQPAAAKLLPELKTDRAPRSVYCLYFAADESPVKDSLLVLNGMGSGPVNNLCVPSQVSASYAADGRSLISVTVLNGGNATDDDDSLIKSVRQQLTEWYGNVVDTWKHLRTYRIPYALPNQTTPAFNPPIQPSKLRSNLYVCGDYRANGSINGAMLSGRLTADELLK